MRILTRYLLRAHIGPFLFALTALTGLLLVNAVAKRFEDLAGKGLEASVILEVFILSIPYIIALTLPMAVLVAVLYAFSQLAADNEITAIKASGINLTRLLVPLVVAGTLMAAGMIWFNDRVLPETNHRLKNLLVDIGRKSPTLELKEQVINRIETGDMRTRYYLRAAKIEPATNRLRDVVIYDLSETERTRSIYADSGWMAFNEDRTDLFLTLYDGVIHQTTEEDARTFQRMFFEKQYIRIAGVGDQLERTVESSYRSDREMSIAMLAGEAASRRQELDEVRAQAAAVTADALRRALGGPVAAAAGGLSGVEGARDRVAIPPYVAPDARLVEDDLTRRTAFELRTLASRAEMLEQQINSFDVEYQKKFSIPIACIVFVLIGAPIAVRFPRGGVGMVIAVSLTIFTVYYMGLIGGESLGDKGFASAFWAMWTPNALFMAVAVWGLLYIGRAAATPSGGGWEDMFQTLRGLASYPVRAAARAAGRSGR